MPRSYVPTLLAVQLPELMLALGLCGTAGAIFAIASKADQSTAAAGRRAALLATVLAVLLPVLVTVATRPAMYNGIRHFIFVLPPLAALGGLAAAQIAARLARPGRIARRPAAFACLCGLRPPFLAIRRRHPYHNLV